MVVFGVLVLCILASHPAVAGPTLEGWFELRPEPDGKSVFAVHGWAVAVCDERSSTLPEVVLVIDGEENLRGHPFFTWPGLDQRFPEIPDDGHSGFIGEVDPASLSPGEHRLEVVMEACGVTRSLGTRSFLTSPPTPNIIAVPVLLGLLAGTGLLGFGLARLRPDRRVILRLPAVVAGVSLAVVVVVVGARQVADAVQTISGGFFAPLANWDGNFYLGLAANGYGNEVNSSFAFFPLFPALLSLLSLLPGPLELFGALFNLGIFAVAVVLMRKLYPEQDAAIVFFAVLPFAFFHFVVYTEALSLLLALAFVSAVRDRRLVSVACFGFLAAVCRIPAVALVVFALGPFWRRDWRTAAVAVAAPLSGLAAWMLWLGATTGDPLAFLRAMDEFGRATSFNPGGFLDLLVSLPGRGGMVWWELGSLVVVLVGSAALARLGRYEEALYSAALVLIPVFSMRLTSLNRYALAAFPVFILLGGRLAGVLPRSAYRIVVAAELVGLFYFAWRFGLQYWVG